MSQRRRIGGWQVAALSTAGAVGTLALSNWLTQLGRREPRNVLDAAEALYPWTEGSVHYSVRGRGEPMLLLHDVRPGGSSFDYRNVFAQLADRYRVFAPDLLGFGLSGKPAMAYTPRLYTTLIEDFLRQVVGATDQPAHVIAAGQSATFAVLAAAARPQLVRSLVLIEPVGLSEVGATPHPVRASLARLLLRTPLVGESAYNVLVSRAGLRLTLRRRLADASVHVSDDVLDHYYAVAHQPGARFAPADSLFVGQRAAVGDAFRSLSAPTLLLWGQRDATRPVAEARALQEARPGAELRIFASGAEPQVEAADAFTREVVAWLRTAARV